MQADPMLSQLGHHEAQSHHVYQLPPCAGLCNTRRQAPSTRTNCMHTHRYRGLKILSCGTETTGGEREGEREIVGCEKRCNVHRKPSHSGAAAHVSLQRDRPERQPLPAFQGVTAAVLSRIHCCTTVGYLSFGPIEKMVFVTSACARRPGARQAGPLSAYTTH